MHDEIRIMTITEQSAPVTRERRAMQIARKRLAWNRLYRLTSYLESSLWVIPFVAIILVLIIAPLLRWADRYLDWTIATLEPAGAQAMFQTIITLMLSFVVFTFGSLLVAIQVASAQLTPRIIATTILRNNVVRYSVGLFVFTLVIAISALDRADTKVHQLIALATAVLRISSMAAFLFLIDYTARLLRPVSVAAHVGDAGLAVIDSVYPLSATTASSAMAVTHAPTTSPARLVVHEGSSGIALAVDLAALLAEASRTDELIEFVPRVGDFVAAG